MGKQQRSLVLAGMLCRAHQPAAVHLLLAVLVAASAAALGLAAAPQAATELLPADKQALLAFKAGLTGAGGRLMQTWDAATDPCTDWTGVKCSCDDFFEGDTAEAKVCQVPPALAEGARVLQINFGDPRITSWNMLTGTISPALGNLTALRVLNLNANHLYGSLPPALSRLRSLEQLLLSSNRLTGTLPPYLGSFPALKYVALDNNQFTGPVPQQWCVGSWWQFDVQGNAGLCDEVDTCLRSRIVSFAGTSLIDSVNDQDKGAGGYCGSDPPTCEPELGCRILRPEPAFFTNTTHIAFAFSAFTSPAGGGHVRYRWAIGTTRWGRDVMGWVDFAGSNDTEAVQTPKGKVTTWVYSVEWPLNQISLTSGQQYYITVQGSNDAGQQLGTMLSSQPITADVTPPYLPEGASVFSGQDFTNLASQSERSALAASWDPFQDDETGVQYYSYQVFQFVPNQAGFPGYVGPAITNKTQLDFEPSQGEFRVYVINLDLVPGTAYFMRVYATNGAGLEGFRDAPPVTILASSSGGSSSAVSVSKVVILVAVFVGAASAVVALVTYWLMRESMRRHQAARKRLRGQMKNFKYLMQSLVQQVGDAEARQLDELKQLRELAFVITDLENSTAIAAAAPRQFEKVQEMHDSLLRELIGRYHGYEINTEGDAFHVAFKDVQHAVLFCMEVQYQMMELDWPREVLRLGPCKEVKAADGSLVYRGPRIRMGVHWATEGTVAQRLHQITKHRVFTGPAFQVARELSEAAHGGQVLLSHEGWLRLQEDMATASFPVVEQLGQYRVDSWPTPIWVYQVTQLLGRPLHRQQGPLNFLEALEAGWGMSITRPPQPRGLKGHLAFVASRLALEACPGGSASGEASPAISKRLHELLATVAMQFGGYMFRLSESQAAYLLSFASAVDAVRFCHSAQALLMYSQWPADCEDYCGRTELAPDGKPIFKGPRVAMAVHWSCEFDQLTVPRQQAAADEVTTDYLGTAVERVQQLSDAAHGGQVVLSEKAWAAVQDQLPGTPQVVSLGSHLLDASPSSQPLLLMEVMPQVLSRRIFPPPRTLSMVELGYRDAPSAEEHVAFVYVKVHKPAEVVDAEQLRPAVSDDTIIRVLTAYNVTLSKASKLMRELLRQHNGYECKEPEPGKMTLAFRSLKDAVEWACALQQELLGFAWPDTVLEWAECGEVREPDSTTLLWRGLRVKVGIAYGVPSSKAPLNTGRADYFGSVPNLAARLMAVARPGQVLMEGRLGTITELQWREDGSAVLPSAKGGSSPIEFTQLGYLQVKGLEEPKLVYQVLPSWLAGRQYEQLPTCAAARSSRRPMSLRRQGSVDMPGGSAVGSEVSPRLGSAYSLRTPSMKRSGSRLRANILAQTAAGASAGHLGLTSRRHSVETQEGEQFVAVTDMHLDGRSVSVTSSGGSFIRSGWLGMLGARLSGVLGRRGTSVNHSEIGSPRSATDMLPLTSRSGTTGSNAPSFTAGNAHLFGQAATASMPVMGAPHRRSASVGYLVSGPSAMGSAVGSFASDSTLAAAGGVHLAASGGTTPMGAAGSGHNSPPMTATRLRDAQDWSYPGSTLTTPTTQAGNGGASDPWEEGMAMEAALGQEAVQQQQQQQRPHHQHSHSVGLPPRGPAAHQQRIALDSVFAAAAAAAAAGAASRDGSQAVLLPASRTHSNCSAPAFLEAATEIAATSTVIGSGGDQGSGVGGSDSASRSSSITAGSSAATATGTSTTGPPAWQSPARIPPVPPLALQRVSSGPAPVLAPPTQQKAQQQQATIPADEFELLPTVSASAPFGLQPPAPQPALSSRSSSGGLVLGSGSSTGVGAGGGGLSGRRPPGLIPLDTDSLTFDTGALGLESPDTITPGLQYARQVAQLFVEGRRRSTSNLAAAGMTGPTGSSVSLSSSVGGGGGLGAGPSRLGQQSNDRGEGGSDLSSSQQPAAG